MLYRELGDTGLRVSVIAFGGLSLGKRHWNNSTEAETRKCLQMSFSGGVNFFDTSPFYGNGKSEKIIGDVLSGNREEIVIGTKFGVRLEKKINIVNDCSRDSILKEVEMSLKRLKTDYIDIYQLHWYDNKTNLDEIGNVINKLKSEKIIKSFGVCNGEMDFIKDLSKETKIDTIQSVYNILQNDAEKELIPYCRENGTAFIANTPFAQGILTGDFDEKTRFKYGDPRNNNSMYSDEKTFRAVLNYIEGLEKPVNRTALSYILKRPEVRSVIISLNKTEHLKENLKFINLMKN